MEKISSCSSIHPVASVLTKEHEWKSSSSLIHAACWDKQHENEGIVEHV